MKKLITTALVALFAFGTAMAQQPQPQKTSQKPNPPASIQKAPGNNPNSIQEGSGNNPNIQMRKTLTEPPSRNERPGIEGKENKGGKISGNHPNIKHMEPRKNSSAKVNADGIAMEIVRAFPEVKSIKKGEKTTEVYDANKNLLGYALYSKPASNGITGYDGETPLMIALTTDMKVKSVELLENQEGFRYVQTIKNAGLFETWNGMKAKKARKKKVDAVSGATFTSRAIIESFRKAIETL